MVKHFMLEHILWVRGAGGSESRPILAGNCPSIEGHRVHSQGEPFFATHSLYFKLKSWRRKAPNICWMSVSQGESSAQLMEFAHQKAELIRFDTDPTSEPKYGADLGQRHCYGIHCTEDAQTCPCPIPRVSTSLFYAGVPKRSLATIITLHTECSLGHELLDFWHCMVGLTQSIKRKYRNWLRVYISRLRGMQRRVKDN
eukprot:116460-Pelagomonas_calceolata.AAC.2